MSSTPRISLLVPCYNAGRHLPRLIDSVRAQTRPFDDILCYDDGSEDDTVAVAQRLGLTIIAGHRNAGVAHARNQLVAAARTEWFHFHDADDILCATFLERMAPACDERHDVVTCDADWVDEIERYLMIPWRYDRDALARSPLAYLLQHGMSLNNSIIRRQTWAQIGGCDESLAIWEDADVHFRMARNGARFHHVAEVLSIALRRRDSLSENPLRGWQCRLAALEGYAQSPELPSIAPVLAEEAERAASALAKIGNREGTARAVALCQRLGRRPPTTRNPYLRLLKIVLPAYSLLRWQAARREGRA